MSINYNNLTFIIVTFKSENIIFDCLDSLPKNIPVIIVENSENIKFKENIEKKYENVKVLIEKNNGMGTSNNLGIKLSKTDYVFIINPDTKLKEDTIDKLIEASKSLNDFAIISPKSIDKNYPNYVEDENNIEIENKKVISVKSIDGYSMILNKKKFMDGVFFDENIFLYLENDDLCLRKKKEHEKIYIVQDSFIEHKGASSSDQNFQDQIELSRNWHWMWSKFYFNKKHFGIFRAYCESLPNFLSSISKYLFYLALFNTYKRNIYYMRLTGIINSFLGKRAWYRPKI